jgi:hypothetical protein
MSSVWSGPSSALVWLIYCLCNLPISVVRNPGTTPVDSTRMSRRSTVDQGVQRQRFSDANASNDNTSARARDESLRRATVSCHLTLSQLLLSGDPFPGCEQSSPADDALSLFWTTTPIPEFVQPFYQHQPRRTSASYARRLPVLFPIFVAQQQHGPKHDESLRAYAICNASTLTVPPLAVHRHKWSRPCSRDPAMAGGDSFIISHITSQDRHSCPVARTSALQRSARRCRLHDEYYDTAERRNLAYAYQHVANLCTRDGVSAGGGYGSPIQAHRPYSPARTMIATLPSRYPSRYCTHGGRLLYV